MERKISHYTAQQIVEAIKNISDNNANYIDKDGIIFASTDSSRIGTYHEIGKHAYLSGETIEVEDDSTFIGTQCGVNIPIIYQDEIVAVIGITGKPDNVRKYAYLAQKITYLLLREQDLDIEKNSFQNRIGYILASLIAGGNRICEKIVTDYIEEKGLRTGLFRTLIIKIPRLNTGTSIYKIEREILNVFKLAEGDLYSFAFPDEYRMIIEDSKYQQKKKIFLNLLTGKEIQLFSGVGMPHGIEEQHLSYEEAATALKYAHSLHNSQNDSQNNPSDTFPEQENSSLVEYNSLGIETLCVGISDTSRQFFIKRCLEKLSDSDLKLLSAYYQENMSLVRTAQRLYVHKNTLQYKLDKISEKSGFNPRDFKDACCLYTAICLKLLNI